MTDLARNLGVFLRVYLPRDRRASRHTIESYKVSLKLLVLFAAERLSVRPCVIEVEQLTTQLILDFLDSLERERENTVATRNVRLAAIKALFRFLEYRSACYVDLSGQVHAIPKKRSDQKLIDWLERHELQALLDAPDIRTAAGVRDRAMLHLAYAAALRVSELTALRLDSLGQPDIDTRLLHKAWHVVVTRTPTFRVASASQNSPCSTRLCHDYRPVAWVAYPHQR